MRVQVSASSRVQSTHACNTRQRRLNVIRCSAANGGDDMRLGRRVLLATSASSLLLPHLNPGAAQAVQGYIAGRVPGLGPVEEDGFMQYRRPASKQGGHGVGWSEIPQYAFRVPADNNWEEVPVSIADLGGTEIDLRFTSSKQGQLAVVVAPVLRFREEFGFGANVTLKDIGPPDRVVRGFALEILGRPLEDTDVLEEEVLTKDGLVYYNFHVKPYVLQSFTATRNRVFVLTVDGQNSRIWKKHEQALRKMQESFYVDPKTA